MEKKEDLKKVSRLKATVWIGKEGVTERLIAHASAQLNSKKIVKIKVQKSLLSLKPLIEVAEEVAKATGSTIVDIRGRTFTLKRD